MAIISRVFEDHSGLWICASWIEIQNTLVMQFYEYMVRAFIAIEVNNSATIDRIVKLQQELMASTDADIKPVEKQNLHFTMKFLGEISESEISQHIESLRKIESECLDVVYEGLGVFPNMQRMSVVWIGVGGKGKEMFGRLGKKILAITTTAGRSGDATFVPHLTILRVKSGRNKERLIQAINALTSERFGKDKLTSLKLKRSQLTPRGPIYTDLFEIPFRESK